LADDSAAAYGCHACVFIWVGFVCLTSFLRITLLIYNN
jgi:hypothetical protein